MTLKRTIKCVLLDFRAGFKVSFRCMTSVQMSAGTLIELLKKLRIVAFRMEAAWVLYSFQFLTDPPVLNSAGMRMYT